MEALLPVLKGHPFLSVLAFALLFRAVGQLIQRLPKSKAVQQDKFRAWRWRNLSLSMVHSLLSGTWAVIGSLVWPETLKDLHWYHTPMSYLLVCISTGYFAQDAYDIIYSGYAVGSWEILIHHAMVLGCFLYALCTEIYVAGAVVALFVEVNSVTLHLRMLLRMAEAQSTPLYHFNKVANIVTYVVFRLLPQFYLTWYILHYYSQLDHANFFLFCMMLMNIMMLIYFYRLLRSDFFSQRKTNITQNGTHNNNSTKSLMD